MINNTYASGRYVVGVEEIEDQVNPRVLIQS